MNAHHGEADGNDEVYIAHFYADGRRYLKHLDVEQIDAVIDCHREKAGHQEDGERLYRFFGQFREAVNDKAHGNMRTFLEGHSRSNKTGPNQEVAG